MFVKIVTGLIAMTLAIGFFAIPALKLMEIPMLVVGGIGIAMMAYQFYETLREDD